MSEPTARRRRRWPWVVLVLLALAVFAVWWWRDLPRRQVERALADELRADVTVGRLSIEGSRRFTLHDLTVRRMGGQPYLEMATVDRITVGGSLPRLRVADFERLEVSGVTVLVRPPTGEPLPEPDTEPSTLRVGRLALREGVFVVRAGGGETRLPFEADAERIGTDAVGEVRAQASSLALAPVLALLGFPGSPAELRELTASVRLQPGGGGTLDTRIASFVLPERSFPGGSLSASAAPAVDGKALAVDARAELSLARALHGKATLDAATLAPLTANVHAEAVAIGELVRVVPLLPAGASLDGTADLDVTLLDPHRVEVATRAHFTQAAFSQQDLRIDLGGAEAVASATLTRDEGPLRGPAKATLRLPRLTARGASWRVPASAAPATLELSADVGSVTPPRVRGTGSLITRNLGTLSSGGGLEGSPLVADLTWQWSGLTLEVLRTAAAEMGFALPEPLGLQGRALLQGTLRGPLEKPAITGNLTADRIATQWGDRALTGGRLQARFALPPGLARIDVPSFSVSGSASVPPLAPLPVQLAASGHWDNAAGKLTLARATLRGSEGLGTLAFDGSWQGTGTGRVRLADAELPAWLPVLRPLLGEPLAGYSVKGTVGAEASVRLTADGGWSGEGKATIAKSGFASEDGARVLEGLDTAWALRGEGGGARWRAHADAEVGGFQLLWGSVFGDYSAVASRLQVDAHGGDPAAAPWTLEAKLQIPDGPELAGTLSGESWSGSIAVADLARTVAQHLRAPLGGSIPLFERIEAKGRLEMHASGVAGERTRTAAGGLTLTGVDLAGTQGIVGVAGLDVVLPFDLRWTKGGDDAWAIAGPPTNGTVEFDHMEIAGLTLAALKSAVALRGDDLTFGEKLTVPALGGEVRFEGLRLQDLSAPSRHLLSGVLVTGVTLADVSRTFGMPPLEGTVEGLFPEVRLDADTLRVEGGGEVRVFGGSVRLAAISGEDVLTRFPKLQLSAEFTGIDLARVTHVFDFGEIGGIVSGYVKDLRLFRGVPVSLEAAVHSVPTEDVKQYVNVKAVRNLTILGTGARISPLDRGLQRFFDKYTYAEMGIWMKLENDVFLLRGTAGKREDRELFVRGRLPFPINIVNAQPGKTVSFSSMVERLKSVDFSAATSAP